MIFLKNDILNIHLKYFKFFANQFICFRTQIVTIYSVNTKQMNVQSSFLVMLTHEKRRLFDVSFFRRVCFDHVHKISIVKKVFFLILFGRLKITPHPKPVRFPNEQLTENYFK